MELESHTTIIQSTLSIVFMTKNFLFRSNKSSIVTFREISTEFFTLSSGKDKTYFFKQKKCMWRFVFPWKLKLYFFLRKTQGNNLRYEKVDTRQWHGQWLTKYFAAKFSPFKIFLIHDANKLGNWKNVM